jgi:hypothetical protein
MKKTLLVSILLIIMALTLAACGASPAPESGSAPQVKIELDTNPNPVVMGDVELILLVSDQDGSPIEGAKVDVGADHTDMTGMGMHGPATEQGNGRYAINANFSMTGNWKITVYVRQGDLDVKQDISIVVR